MSESRAQELAVYLFIAVLFFMIGGGCQYHRDCRQAVKHKAGHYDKDGYFEWNLHLPSDDPIDGDVKPCDR